MPPTGGYCGASYSLTTETFKEFPRRDNAGGVESTRAPCKSPRGGWRTLLFFACNYDRKNTNG